MKVTEMIGTRWGALTVVRRAKTQGKSKQASWLCLCDCGNESVVLGGNLRSGRTTSCGCAVAEANRRRLVTHGLSRSANNPGHPLYETWVGMRRRCHSPKNEAFARYGGRGIEVCPEWRDDFLQFLADVGERPTPNHSLDRIDNDKGYEPGNVRWATPQEQADNRGPVATLRAENAWLVERVRELIGAICWDTTCLNCSSLLDSNYDQYMRAEKAEAEVARLTAERDAVIAVGKRQAARLARVEALAEEWDGDDSCDNRTCVPHRSADALRDALAGSDADTTDTQPTDQEEQ